MNQKPKGQALVEMALVLPLLLLLLLASTDVWISVADAMIGKHLSARAARAAALSTVPDGITSCQSRVASLMDGEYFMMADWAYSVTNCPSDPLVGIAQASPVTVTLDLSYHPVFLPGNPWSISLVTTDYGR